MKTGFVGAGKMGEAMIASMLGKKVLEAHEISACEVSAERRELLKQKYGINMYSKSIPVVAGVRVLFLAVKPQDLEALLKEIAPAITKEHLVVSIAAGKKIGWIQSFLPEARVIRVMPNLACVVGEGMSVYCPGSLATEADNKTAARLLACFGKVLRLPEELFDAVTALSGSGPAFFAYVMDLMVNAGVQEGMTRKDALVLVEQTMLGTAKLLLEKGQNPQDLVKAVSSPKGTTVAGLAVLEKSSIADILSRTIHAAAERSRELSRG